MSSHRQNDVLGVDANEAFRNLIKELEAERDLERRMDTKEEVWTPTSVYRGPWGVKVEQKGKDLFVAVTIDPMPHVPILSAWGPSRQAAVDALNGNLAFALVHVGVCETLEEAAHVAIESRFDVVKTRSVFL